MGNRKINVQGSNTSQDENIIRFPAAIPWLLLGFILLSVIAVRVRLLNVPLERDEGEYAYIGQLMLQGVPPYSGAYSMKLPGTSLAYAGIMSLFGQSVRGIHLGLILLNCATIVLLFYLGRKLMNDFSAVVASGTYAVLSLSSSVFGFAAHAEHFVVLPALGGALLLQSAVEENRPLLYFFSGTLFGLAFLMKQPGLFFVMFGLSYLIYVYNFRKPRPSSIKIAPNLALFTSGVLLPILASALWLYEAGVFDTFWFWTVRYAMQYGSQVQTLKIFGIFADELLQVVDGFFLVWIIASAGLAVLVLRREPGVNRAFILLFFLFSFLSICPGFYFREHYFVSLLPAVSISAGLFVHYLNSKAPLFLKSRYAMFAGTAIFIAAIVIGIGYQEDYFFKKGPVAISRKLYAYNPFPESIEIAKFIKANTNDTDRIAVLGSEPEIYFYSHRRSATGHIYMYGLMEKHAYALSMQKEMIADIESARPKFIVLVAVEWSWLIQPYSERHILDWMNAYVKSNYRLVGAVDMISDDRIVYTWGDDAGHYRFVSPDRVLVFQRSDSMPQTGG